MRRYQVASLAQGTSRTYSSGEKQFLNFCYQFKLHETAPILPTTENILIYFAVFLAQTLNPGTIKVYLAAVRNLHLINGFDLPLSKFLRLQYILRGIKRVKGVATRLRLPITLVHLKLFFRLLHCRAVPAHNDHMLWAAISLAFFGFLRIGEMTCYKKFDPSIHLCPTDITFHPCSNETTRYMCLTIKASKTDPFRSAVKITIGANDSELCPVLAMKNYLSRRVNSSGPLFQYSNGTALSRTQFTNELRSLLALGGYTSSNFSGHSFRIGAATTAASQNLPHWLIQTLGRWSSDCYLRYIRTPVHILADVSKQLITDLGKF